MLHKYPILIGICLCLTACLSSSPTGQAEKAMRDFYQSLADGNYPEAAALYGGSYENLEGINPAIAPEAHADLWKAGCALNGFKCLPILDVLDSRQLSTDEFVFTVEFRSPDGQVFVFGPCCGASVEEMPPVSQFEIHVRHTGRQFLVMEPPPYVP